MSPRVAHRRSGRRGFTLAELLVASIIGAFVIGATYAALSQVIRGRDGATARQQAFSRAALAAELMARDVEMALRDADLRFAKVQVTRGGSTAEPRDELLVFTAQPRPVRPWSGTPEGVERESHYRVLPSGLGANGGPATALWRRVDPVPDETPDGGGIAAPLVDGVVALSVVAADSEQWFDQWDSDSDGLPHAVRITVWAMDDLGRYTAVARRTVAIDRVPVPAPPPEETDDTSTGTDTTPPAGGNTGGTGGAGGAGGGGGGAGGGGGGTPRGGGGGAGGGSAGGGGGAPR